LPAGGGGGVKRADVSIAKRGRGGSKPIGLGQCRCILLRLRDAYEYLSH